MHKNVAMCHWIAEVIAADGVLDERELAYLENTMEDYGLTDEERHQVRGFQNAGADAAAADISDADKAKLRDDLLAATLIDGQVSSLETEKVRRITELLGL